MYVYVMACIHSHVSEGRRREEGRVGERERDGKKEVGKKKLKVHVARTVRPYID